MVTFNCSPPSREGQGWVSAACKAASSMKLTPAPNLALEGGEEKSER